MTFKIRLDIAGREPFAEGMSFGDVGSYEHVYGDAHFAVDPDSEAFNMIVDLDKAPRNDDGLVEYSTHFYILRPTDLSRGNRRLIYDVNNRGNLRILQFFNDGVHSNIPHNADHAGNGFLMRRGYSIVWSGWQGDLLDGDYRMTMRLPMATDHGKPITGITRCEYIADSPGVTNIPLSANDYTRSYEAATLDKSKASLTMREYEGDERQPISPHHWEFAKVLPDGTTTISGNHLYLPERFKSGWIYEFIYTAKNPQVMGLGLTGVRDLISFLLYEEADIDGTANPLRENGTGIEKAYGWGRSQSGRFLREFVYRGFNEDAEGRQVFSAISPHVSGGGRIILNYRFSQPGRYPRQHSDRLYPSDQFPFAYSETYDPLTGKTDSILKRPETDPLVIHTQTSAEYWERRGSLVHTDADGNDIEEHPNSRIFMFTGSQHNADPLGGPDEGVARYATNALNTTPLLRALLDVLDDWATDGTPPPDSRIPRRSEETAVPADVAAANFPTISGVEHPQELNRLFVQDHGDDFDNGVFSNEPPVEDLVREYMVQIPQVGPDGNEVAGLKTPDVEVPLATYTGWNYRLRESSGEALAGLTGSYLPFSQTKDDRTARGDSRPSLEERYASREDYVEMVTRACETLVQQRLLLQEDADRYIEKARAVSWPTSGTTQ